MKEKGTPNDPNTPSSLPRASNVPFFFDPPIVCYLNDHFVSLKAIRI